MSEKPYSLHRADCLEFLPTLSENTFDSIITDPPYGLSFMGKSWDHGIPGKDYWVEALRVAKPGAYLCAFGGTRTYHRLMCAIEDAGWEIRDCIMWVYASGFPKSMDVSKAIDKQGGGCGFPENDRKAFAEELKLKREAKGWSRSQLAACFTHKEVTKNWERTDSGFRVPCEQDYDVLVQLLGISKDWRLKVRAEDKRRLVSEELEDRRGDETVLGLGHSGKKWEATTDLAKQWNGWGTALKPAWEPIIVARKPFNGTLVQNITEYGTGGINIDASRVPLEEADNSQLRTINRNKRDGGDGWGMSTLHGDITPVVRPEGRWPANLIHDGSEEVLDLFPETQSGKAVVGTGGGSNRGTCYSGETTGIITSCYADKGSAARFFYCAKASKQDRDWLGDMYVLSGEVPKEDYQEICRILSLEQ